MNAYGGGVFVGAQPNVSSTVTAAASVPPSSTSMRALCRVWPTNSSCPEIKASGDRAERSALDGTARLQKRIDLRSRLDAELRQLQDSVYWLCSGEGITNRLERKRAAHFFEASSPGEYDDQFECTAAIGLPKDFDVVGGHACIAASIPHSWDLHILVIQQSKRLVVGV